MASLNSRRPAPDSAILKAWEHASLRERLILRLAGELGLRRTEIALVHSRDLVEDLDGWSLLVHGKGNRNRILPLSASLSVAIREATLSGGGYAFPGNDNGHLSPRWVGTLISRILPRDVTLHQLRHRFATLTHQETGDVRLVQALLGHSSLATTQRYIDMHSDQLRAGLERATSRLTISPALKHRHHHAAWRSHATPQQR
ncbi:tyrosine-type recombinase/integrase [Pseudactinotalea sp. Z1748]|uniref:tyrosine-type recombinase/integrase n=1 Tax=Pseudactinotalea sp. Z1748 TaxID=3413027 RepID=UPI003C79FD17